MHCCAYAGGQLCFVGSANDQEVILPIFAPPVKKLKKRRVDKQQPKPVAEVHATYAPAPLQCGGSLEKTFSSDRWSRKDSVGHYRQRCGEHNHREQVFHKTERRRLVARY